MAQKCTFSKSVSALVAAVTAVTAFTREPLRIWLLVGAFAVWGLYNLRRIISKARKRNAVDANYEACKDSDETAALLRLNLRITDMLRASCVSAAWSWLVEKPEEIAVNGGCGWINVYSGDGITRTEVKYFDGEIKLTPQFVSGSAAEWYAQNKRTLDEIAADFGSRGFERVTISENGEAYTQNEFAAALEKLPDRELWQELSEMMTEDGYDAFESCNCLVVEWKAERSVG